MKEPVLRLNKDLREEILGNVLKGRFNTQGLRHEIALEGFRLLKQVHAAFRTTVKPWVRDNPSVFRFDEHDFTIRAPRVKGKRTRYHSIYLVDFLTPEEKEEVDDMDCHSRHKQVRLIACEFFEGEPEVVPANRNQSSEYFKGFVTPVCDTEIPEEESRFWELTDKLNEAEKNLQTLSDQTSAVLNSCYTMRQLVEVWPNVVEYAPTLIPSPSSTSLIIRVEDIDALIKKGA